MAKKSSDDELLIAKARYLHEYAQRAYAHSVVRFGRIDRKGSRLSRVYIATVALVSAISLAFLLATIRAVLPEAAG